MNATLGEVARVAAISLHTWLQNLNLLLLALQQHASPAELSSSPLAFAPLLSIIQRHTTSVQSPQPLARCSTPSHAVLVNSAVCTNADTWGRLVSS
ncbi:hypothetical protein V6N13_029984 [Hibiscus sabdariffa]|uniref:Uncharacterized protein n=2 Tax=Hibiscus sabdariffa TaxID=183260 RepID=A0ABR1ZR48_9ROSI